MVAKSVTILTPVGMLGYGYETARLYQGIKMGASAIIVDAGSTDSGPQKLALGEGTCPPSACGRDLGPILDACFHHKVKVIISSAGGDGSNQHVDEVIGMVNDYCTKKSYELKLARIYANIDKAVVHKALKAGKITPCTGAVPELTTNEVDAAVEIVAQMGTEPFTKALKKVPDLDVIIAGRTYDPAPYAAYALANGITNIATAFHMGKVMECGAQCGWPKSKEALAIISDDQFEVLPLQPFAKCSTHSLAAHSLYENARTDLHPGPGGVLDITNATYTQTGPRSAGASGAKFHVADPYTVKLEGAKILGFRSIWIGSFRDPVLISQIDDFLDRCKKFLQNKFKDVKFDVAFKPYGKNGTMGPREPDTGVAKEIFLLGEIQAENQVLATQIANAGRVFCVHAPYEGQRSTTGNFAMPVTPLEIPLGPCSVFNIYHLMNVEDPTSLFPITEMTVGSSKNPASRDPNFGFDLIVEDAATNGTFVMAKEQNGYPTHDVPLTMLAKDIRSKNAGPYEITYDVIFNDLAAFKMAKASSAFSVSSLARLLKVDEGDVITCQFSEAARAFKLTLPRPWCAGGFNERDLHCSQQHVPLLDIVV